MKSCLFCGNTRIFNIHNDYGNNSHTAKDDMLQFFGYQIESHLRPDDAICNLCMNIMDNVAKLKRRLLPLIFRSEPSYMEDCKPINFGKKWDVFASMNFDEDNDAFLESRSPTPNNLLKCKRVVPYETQLEMKIAEIERHRSLSRVSVAKSDADSEIVNAFSKKRPRKRKRGHNWTRRKNGRYSRLSTDTTKSPATTYSTRSYTRSRPISVMSIMSTESYESFYPPALEASSPTIVTAEKSNLKYVDSCLQNKRTRSVARQKEDSKLALFWCNYCGKKYSSNYDLDVHKGTHAEQYSCVICHKEFCFDVDLLQHWQEHVKKAVACKYCGKRFVDKNICNKHQVNVHKRNIPSRIDYNKDVEHDNVRNKDFEVRVLVQDGSNLIED